MITFFAKEAIAAGSEVRLDEAAAQHARVRRVRPGDAVQLLDGRGTVGRGQVTAIGRRDLTVAVAAVAEVASPVPLEVIVPVADRDRMLVAAEKCAELQVTAWRPARFARSRSVSHRGEGEKFRLKVAARMQGALEQSGNAWLPTIHEERDFADVLATIPTRWTRLLLDSSGTSLVPHISIGPIALAVGPEGGVEPQELERARSLGWVVASLGPGTMRFETAIIAAMAVVRTLQHAAEAVHG